MAGWKCSNGGTTCRNRTVRPTVAERLIRLGGAAVNNTDVNTRLAWYSKGDGDAADATWTGKPLEFPHIQGADGCGRVVSVGPGADASLIGKRVLIEPCLREVGGQPVEPFWYIGSETPGTFAEFIAVPARHAHVSIRPVLRRS